MFHIYSTRELKTDTKNILDTQAGTEPKEIRLPFATVLLYPKKLIPLNELFVETNSGWIFGTGTWSYKSFSGCTSLNLLMQDIATDNVDRSKLRGQFVLLYHFNDQLNIFTDASGIMNIYYDNETISSSFLAILYSKNEPAQLNKFAALETICTGNLVGPDTLVHGINRFMPVNNFESLHQVNIDVIHFNEKKHSIKYKTRKEALEQQVAAMDELMLSFKELAENTQVDTGITGGLDSRLLLAFALRNWPQEQINVYTNSRVRRNGEKIIDEPIAVKVAGAVGKKLKLGWMKHPADLTEEELQQTIKESYLFSDAHVRMHIQYFESYSTKDFKVGLLENSRFNMSGIGGEQYRNQERFTGKYWNGKKFIAEKTMKHISGDIGGSYYNELVDYIYTKTKNRLGITKDNWSFVEVKQYYNEIINGERLAARNNMENKLSWFLSPFAEAKIAFDAYSITAYLGLSPKFQVDMLNMISEKLGAIETDYGFTPAKGIPVKIRFADRVKAMIPWSVFYKYRIKTLFASGRYALLKELKRFEIIRTAIETLEKIFPEINLNEILIRPDVMPIAINLGYMINYELENGKIKL